MLCSAALLGAGTEILAAPLVGDRVWHDENADGIQDLYEPGVDGVVIDAFDLRR